MKLFFDLARQDKWHRMEWERCLAEASGPQGSVSLAGSRQNADFVIVPETPQLTEPLARIFRRVPAGEFVWDFGDQPAGRHPGFYCSLARPLFDATRHRSFCYPITFNELVDAYDAADAMSLFSFVGAISSPLRDRVLRYLLNQPIRAEGLIKVQGGPWHAMFDRSGLETKREFAESLRRSRFVLCPRGNGVGSVRLFEVMKAARVPVIISDDYVLPDGVDWAACSIRVRERDFERIPKTLLEHDPRWEPMAISARREWERWFSPANLFGALARHLHAMRSSNRSQNLRSMAQVVSAVAKDRVKTLYRRIQARRQTLRVRS